MASANDKGMLEVSADGGGTWTVLENLYQGSTSHWDTPEIRQPECLWRN